MSKLRLFWPKSRVFSLNSDIVFLVCEYRHTFAVHAINDGMALNILSRLLGYASTDVTERVYAKILPQTLSSEVERLGYSFLPENFS